MRGWTVERYQVDLRQAAELNMLDMEHAVRGAGAGRHARHLEVHATYRGRSFKHVLMPVRLVSYTYGRRAFQLLVNGYTGTMAGQRPWSAAKITLAVIAALLVVIAYMWLDNPR